MEGIAILFSVEQLLEQCCCSGICFYVYSVKVPREGRAKGVVGERMKILSDPIRFVSFRSVRVAVVNSQGQAARVDGLTFSTLPTRHPSEI